MWDKMFVHICGDLVFAYEILSRPFQPVALCFTVPLENKNSRLAGTANITHQENPLQCNSCQLKGWDKANDIV